MTNQRFEKNEFPTDRAVQSALVCFHFDGIAVAQILFESELTRVPSHLALDPEARKNFVMQMSVGDLASDLRREIHGRMFSYIEDRMTLGLGLANEIWDWLDQHRSDIQSKGTHSIKLAKQIGRAASEVGLYELACALGTGHAFSDGRAATISKNGSLMESSINLILKDHENHVRASRGLLARWTEIQLTALEALRLRIQGDLESAYDLVRTELMDYLRNQNWARTFEFGADSEAFQRELEVVSDIMGLCGTVCFYNSQYAEALEFYERGFETARQTSSKSRWAVGSFNISVAAAYLGLEQLSKHSMGVARKFVGDFSVPGLLNSMDLFELETLVYDGKFLTASQGLEKFATRSTITTLQRIQCLQARTRCLLELGFVADAEILLANTRSLIRKHGIQQYEIFQRALEEDLEALAFRETNMSGIGRAQPRSRDFRGFGALRVSQARKALYTGMESEKARRLLSEAQIDQLKSRRNVPYIEDVRILLDGMVFESMRNPRAFESLWLRNVLIGSKPRYQFILDLLDRSRPFPEETNGPWVETLREILKALIALELGDKDRGRVHAEEAIAISDRVGLDRLGLVALAISSFCDPHRQFQLMRRLNEINPQDRRWFNHLFTKMLGERLTHMVTVITKDQEEILEDAKSVESCDLLIDMNVGHLVFQKEIYSVGNQTVLLTFISQIAMSGAKGLSKSEIIEAVWGYDYDPLVHDPVIYSNIRRLRDLLPIELHMGRYRLPSQLTWKYIPANHWDAGRSTLTDRQRGLVLLFRDNPHKRITRKEAASALNVSLRTALRELSYMTRIGILNREGKGSASHYALLSEEVGRA